MSNSTQSKRSAVVIYDGECRFCIARVGELEKADTERQLEFMPRQAKESEQRFPQIKGIALDEGILLIDNAGQVHVAADAMYQIYKRLPSTRNVAWLYDVPGLRQVFQLGYRAVAANRRRLGQVCTDDHCKLPK
jgi:predicted DCC family thiol-disulfide oxidoreductase YuxK